MNNKGALLTVCVDVEVPFQDCDPMQVVWHGNYVRYLEEARRTLLKKINYDYAQMEASGFVWPVVDMRVKYVDSATYSQIIRVHVYLKEYESRLKLDYVISDLLTGKVLTKAYTVQVAVAIKNKEMQFESPKVFIDKLMPWLEQ